MKSELNENQQRALGKFAHFGGPAYPYQVGSDVRIPTCLALERRGLLRFVFEEPAINRDWYKFEITEAGKLLAVQGSE